MWPCFLGDATCDRVDLAARRPSQTRTVGVGAAAGGVGLETRSTIAELVFCL